MRLAAPDKVIAALGIQPGAGALAVAGAALDLTYFEIEAALDTRLQEYQWVDYFDFGSPRAYFPAGGDTPTLYLSAMLVTPAAVVLRESNDGAVLASGDAGTLVDPARYTVDKDAGTLRLHYTPAAGLRALSVGYTAGLSIGLDGTTLDEVPGWLEQAAITLAMRFLQLNPPNLAKDKAKLTATTARALYGEARHLLAPYLRPRVGLTFPVAYDRREP